MLTAEAALELLPDYVVGALDEAEARAIEAVLASSPELRREAQLLAEALDQLGAALPPVAPSAEARARLLDAAGSEDRFLPFVERIARWSDLAVEAVRLLVRRIDQATAWEPGPLPGIELIHFEHGPAAIGVDTGFVRFAPGFRFPMHTHAADEVNYVLEGALIDSDGTVYGPGEALLKDPTMVHAFETAADRPTVLFVAQSGFEIVGPHPAD
jgi:anti-sigma factor ChrR (cupin superfamily)